MVGISKTYDYRWQREVFRMARRYGWPGGEPSMLGTPSADAAYESARQYLLMEAKGRVTISGICHHCLWAGEWTDWTAKDAKCPDCGRRQSLIYLRPEEK